MKIDRQRTAGIIIMIVGLMLGVQAIAVHHFFDGKGVLYLIMSIIAIICSLIICYRNGLSLFFLYLIVVVFLALGYHVQPHVASAQRLSDNDACAPFLLSDEHVFCSPFDSSMHYFSCISHDNNCIKRSERCILCGRKYSDHYPRKYSIQKWISSVANKRSMTEMDMTR